jgi:hypothetical protein
MISARRCIIVLAAGLGLVSSGALAQMPGSIPGVGGAGRKPGGNAAPDKPEIPPPDAIPGAKARAPAAPATKAVSDMQPTDALFDAINRGDIAAARDALNRGADLNGVNILGMTPMELSVDLGRNDISFLLLSMRGEDGGRGSRAAAHNPAPEGKPAKAPPVIKTASGSKAAPPARNAVPDATKTATGKPVGNPKLFANDGGTPLPSAGFLGFDSRQATN